MVYQIRLPIINQLVELLRGGTPGTAITPPQVSGRSILSTLVTLTLSPAGLRGFPFFGLVASSDGEPTWPLSLGTHFECGPVF